MIEIVLVGIGLSGFHAIATDLIELWFGVSLRQAVIAAAVATMLMCPFISGAASDRIAKFVLAAIFVAIGLLHDESTRDVEGDE